MSKIVNLESKGQYIKSVIMGMPIENTNNAELDSILESYRNYLIENEVCPSCYEDLFPPDNMINSLHCHNESCRWDEDYKKYTVRPY